MTKGGSGQGGRRMAGTRRQTRSLLSEFLDALALEGRSPHSVRSYRRDLEPLLAALPPRFDQVHPADLRDHFRAQQQAGRAPSSINHAIAAARSFFNFLVDNRVLDSSPAISLRSIRVGPTLAPKHLTVEEVERLLAEPKVDTPSGVRDLALLSFLYNTGLRVGELCALNRADVQLPADGWGQVQLVGKGRRLRWVPINAQARRTLEDYLAQREDDILACHVYDGPYPDVGEPPTARTPEDAAQQPHNSCSRPCARPPWDGASGRPTPSYSVSGSSTATGSDSFHRDQSGARATVESGMRSGQFPMRA